MSKTNTKLNIPSIQIKFNCKFYPLCSLCCLIEQVPRSRGSW